MLTPLEMKTEGFEILIYLKIIMIHSFYGNIMNFFSLKSNCVSSIKNSDKSGIVLHFCKFLRCLS